MAIVVIYIVLGILCDFWIQTFDFYKICHRGIDN